MPVKTPKFGLEAFIRGDVYSATIDKRRFLSIDSHMDFISSIIGDGIISGWNLYQDELLDNRINISPGFGLIDKNTTRTFGELYVDLSDNNTYYLYMKRRAGLIGGLSGFSEMKSISTIDTLAPDEPTNLIVSDITFNSCNLSWDKSTDFDVEKYGIYISNDGVNYDLYGYSFSDEINLENLDQNKQYYVKIKSIDFSLNESIFSSIISFLTEKDLSIPSNPIGFQSFAGNKSIQLIWFFAPYGNISNYKIVAKKVDQENIEFGDEIEILVDSEKNNYILNNLDNNQRYKISIFSISINNIESDGIIIYDSTFETNAPQEVENITVTDEPSGFLDSNIQLNISWDPYIDEYLTNIAEAYDIVLIENGENGIINSDSIRTIENNISISIFSFNDENDGLNKNKNIESRTLYYIVVQSIGEDGSKSPGRVITYNTRDFINPNPPVRLSSLQNQDQSILFSWQEDVPSFTDDGVSSFIITITERDLESSDTVTIINNLNIGRVNRYILENSFIKPNKEYTFFIKSIDGYGNQSNNVSIDFNTLNLDFIPNPAVPEQIFITSGDSQVYLSWSPVESSYISYYNIWRSERKSFYSPSDFTLVERVDGETLNFFDYEVENGKVYVYFITCIDIYGKQSKNPIDDSFIDYIYAIGNPTSSGVIGIPNNLVLTKDDPETGDVKLSWDFVSGDIDGYEIYRSVGDKSNFNKIGNVDFDSNEYIDEKVIKDSTSYYWIVRSYRNEADVIPLETNSPVEGSVFLGSVTLEDGEVSFDTSLIKNIKNIESLINEKSLEIINSHRHLIENGVDKRINLSDSVLIDDWQTVDYQTFFTNEDISEANSAIVYINNEISEFIYTINYTSGLIVFEEQLFGSSLDNNEDVSFPFSEEPVISVYLTGLEEVSSVLSSERIDNISSTKIISGKLSNNNIKNINHDGIVNKKIFPLQIKMSQLDDGYRYIIDKNQSPIVKGVELDLSFIGNGTVFYDLILDDRDDDYDLMIAGTSKGILISDDFGSSWDIAFITETPVLKFYYFESLDRYFALTNTGVYISSGSASTVNNNDLTEKTSSPSRRSGFLNWQYIKGTENVKVCRDITEDNDGNLYVSTNLGIYKLAKEGFNDNFYWRQTPIFGIRSSESFAMIYDESRNSVLVSNELGIFETKNNGITWNFTSLVNEQKEFFSFFAYNGNIFALSNYNVWRKKENKNYFEKIATLNSDIARKIVVWKNRIYITTDMGLYASDTDSNILNDYDIEFKLAFPGINKSNGSYVANVFSINIINDSLFIGSENSLYISEDGKTSRIYFEDSENGIIPSLFINGVEQKIGYRYVAGNNSPSICFDQIQGTGNEILVANQYKHYYYSEGGWADSDFRSKLDLSINNRKINCNNYFDLYLSNNIEDFKSDFDNLFVNYFNENNLIGDEFIEEFLSYKSELDLLLNDFYLLIENYNNEEIEENLSNKEISLLLNNIFNVLEKIIHLYNIEIINNDYYIVYSSGQKELINLPSIINNILINNGDKIINTAGLISYNYDLSDIENKLDPFFNINTE